MTRNWRTLAICLLMFVGAGLAWAMTPRHKLAHLTEVPQLENIIPTQFGDWRVDTSIVPVTLSPDVQAKLDQIYNQVLNRTYVNDLGQRIMLSIAYGGEQSDAMRAHLPESCYAAQGFVVTQIGKETLDAGLWHVPVMRVFAKQGGRYEPITYWIRVGDKTVRGFFEQRIIQLKYGLTGRVTDGALVRVSSISSDLPASYALQDRFVADLLKAVQPDGGALLAGRAG